MLSPTVTLPRRTSPRVAIILPAWNRPQAMLELTLDSILSQAAGHEVIVVNDGDPDLRPCFGVTWLDTKRKHDDSPYRSGWLNPAIPVNAGIRHAKRGGAAVLVLTQAECLWPPHTLEAYLEAFFAHATPTMVSPGAIYMLTQGSPSPSDLEAVRLNPAALEPGHPLFGTVWHNRPSLGNVLLAATWAYITRGMDETWDGAGACDTDWEYRLSNLGVERAFAESVSLIHQWHPEDHRNYAGDPGYDARTAKARQRLHGGIIHVNDEDWGLLS